jgi:hypothetical protein
VAEISFPFSVFQELLFLKELKNPIDGDIDNIQVAKHMLLILLVNLALADEDMIERFLNEHMKDIVLLVLEEETNQAAKESRLAYPFIDLHAGYRDAVAKDLY